MKNFENLNFENQNFPFLSHSLSRYSSLSRCCRGQLSTKHLLPPPSQPPPPPPHQHPTATSYQHINSAVADSCNCTWCTARTRARGKIGIREESNSFPLDFVFFSVDFRTALSRLHNFATNADLVYC